MKLTKDQIADLYAFTRKHYVEHYDLQTELVDHLANGIEAQWQEHAERTFEDARLREFRKFGVGGFEKVVRKRRNAMSRKYWQTILRFYKEYFRLPKIIMALGLTVLVALLYKSFPLEFRYHIIIGVFFIIVASLLFIQFKNRANNELEMVKYGKKWMLKDQIFTYGNIAGLINLIPLTLNFQYFRNNIPMDNMLVLLGFAFLTVAICLLSYITFVIIPKKSEELLAEIYPEYKMA
ncbi:MAG: hypothetical protein WBM83_17085 [Flavobacteriaceae bacterium]